VAVDQEGVAKEGLKTSIDLLEAGRALLVFPEGERTLTGKMNPFKPGISLLLKRVSVPIVPVGVAGAFEAYPRKAKFPKLSPLFWPATGHSVAVAVGRPIPSARFQKVPREQMLEELFGEVRAMVERAERLRRKL
jgi:1-acyl-sn-glycerol-3-phosphate acyltransferase